MRYPMRRLTPLRYPGGKAQLAGFFGEIVELNGLSDGVYVEPFAGGAGVGIALLLGEYVDSILINDIDPAVFAFWKSVVDHNAELCELVSSAPLTVEEWKRQRSIYGEGTRVGHLALGFAMFYLNRTNRSGILNGGIIGGKSQKGAWKIDARFNRDDLVMRIRRIGRYRSRIHVSKDDAVKFLRKIQKSLPRRALLYLDPPYYEKGQHLYTNYYRHDDHLEIASVLRDTDRAWVVSYDDHGEIRKLYKNFRHSRYALGYSARERRQGSEVMFFSPDLQTPRSL